MHALCMRIMCTPHEYYICIHKNLSLQVLSFVFLLFLLFSPPPFFTVTFKKMVTGLVYTNPFSLGIFRHLLDLIYLHGTVYILKALHANHLTQLFFVIPACAQIAFYNLCLKKIRSCRAEINLILSLRHCTSILEASPRNLRVR